LAEEGRGDFGQDFQGVRGFGGGTAVMTPYLKNTTLATTGIFGDLDGIAKRTDTWRDKTDKALERLKLVFDQLEKIAEAQKKQEIAELELYRATHPGSDTKVEGARLAIEEKYAAKGRQREGQFEQSQNEEKKKAASAMQVELQGLTPKLGPAEEAAKLAENEARRLEQNRETARQKRKMLMDRIAGTDKEPGLQQKVDELGLSEGARAKLSRFKSVEEFRRAYPPSFSPSDTSSDFNEIQAYGDTFVALNVKLQGERAIEVSMAAKERESAAAVGPAGEKAQRLRKEANELASRAKKLAEDERATRAEAEKLQYEHDIKGDARKEIGRTETATRRIENEQWRQKRRETLEGKKELTPEEEKERQELKPASPLKSAMQRFGVADLNWQHNPGSAQLMQETREAEAQLFQILGGQSNQVKGILDSFVKAAMAHDQNVQNQLAEMNRKIEEYATQGKNLYNNSRF
jgi:hypothetical protein